MLQLVPLSFQPAMNLASRRGASQLHPLLATLCLARIWRLRCSLNVPLSCSSVSQDSFAPRFFERATRFSERAPSLSERAPDLFERALCCLMIVAVSFHSAFPFPRKRQKESVNSRPTAHAAAAICNVSSTSLPPDSKSMPGYQKIYTSNSPATSRKRRG